MMDKKTLSERDICTKFITPALEKAGWNKQLQFLEEVSFTDGKILVEGKLTKRDHRKRADYILYYKPNIPIAVIEAKDNKHSVGAGMQQALEYAVILDIPFVFSSNGDGFLFHDRTIVIGQKETQLNLDSFPSPKQLWDKYKKYKGIETEKEEKIITQDYFIGSDATRKPRYYQQIAINTTVEAIAKGQNRLLLVMATGTGKTYTAFQIIYRLWKSGTKKRILFLADRNILLDQARKADFRYFGEKMTAIKNRQIDKSFEIYLALYQGLSGADEEANVYKQFSKNFFDLIVIDECHRGSANEDSNWRNILNYFDKATQIGLTATPKETNDTSNSEYFGTPVYTYSLKQGIEDGFLAPYSVLKITLNVDAEGWRPGQGKVDKEGHLVEDRIYNSKDFDKNLVIDERTEIVAKKITEFLKGFDRFAKTIVFCMDIDHAERMRSALANQNADLVAQNYKYVMRITGDDEQGKKELDNFINPEEIYPVIATTSELMTTGVDAQTCKLIVLDANINSMTKFKQIIGRGTRINEAHTKYYFTILDFRKATDLFADPQFDGDPLVIKPLQEKDSLEGIMYDEHENIATEEAAEEVVRTIIRYPEFNETNERQKIYVNEIDVSILAERKLEIDANGKLITTSLKDYTKTLIQKQFASLDDFLHKWKDADRKQALVEELANQDVRLEQLFKAVNREVDLFDLICHIAYDQPPLTRKERANQVKKRNYFSKYGVEARKVLEALLDKYADFGIEEIDKLQILNVPPFSQFGSVMEIIKSFGGRAGYDKAVKELKNELYNIA